MDFAHGRKCGARGCLASRAKGEILEPTHISAVVGAPIVAPPHLGALLVASGIADDHHPNALEIVIAPAFTALFARPISRASKRSNFVE